MTTLPQMHHGRGITVKEFCRPWWSVSCSDDQRTEKLMRCGHSGLGKLGLPLICRERNLLQPMST